MKDRILKYTVCDKCGYEYAKVIRGRLIDCICGIRNQRRI